MSAAPNNRARLTNYDISSGISSTFLGTLLVARRVAPLFSTISKIITKSQVLLLIPLGEFLRYNARTITGSFLHFSFFWEGFLPLDPYRFTNQLYSRPRYSIQG